MKIGSSDISAAYIGSTAINKVYIGSTEVWTSFTGLLDTYTGAAAAYSLRLLRSAYTGYAIKVRRASDNTEQDIGFSNNELDTTTLASFCSGTDGFVQTIYDQSGNGNNYTQDTLARQGQIVSSGSVILLNSKPVIIRSADNNGGYLASGLDFQGDTNIYGMYYVGIVGNANACMVGSSGSGGGYAYLTQSGGTSTAVSANMVTSSEVLNGNNWTYTTRDDVYNDLNVQFIVSNGIQFNEANIGIALGYRFSNPSNLGMMSFQEQIIYPNTNNQSNINILINDFYSIY